MTSAWRALSFLAASSLLLGAIVSAEIRGPEDLRCPDGTQRAEVTDSRRWRRIECRRPDGERLGPFAVWFDDGRLAERGAYAEHDGHQAASGLWESWDRQGGKVSEGRYEDGQATGPWIRRLPEGGEVTTVYFRGRVVAMYPGREPLSFVCPEGSRPRSRIRTRSPLPLAGPQPPTFLERWCEAPVRGMRHPLRVTNLEPAPGVLRAVRCVAGPEDTVLLIRAFENEYSFTDVLALPPAVRGASDVRVQAWCGDPETWGGGRPQGPYLSISRGGSVLEEGRYEDGERHGLWRVRGRVCAEWRRGIRGDTLRCPGQGVAWMDPWEDALRAEIASAAQRLGWPPLSAKADGTRELLIWRLAPATGISGARGEHSVLRLLASDSATTGTLASWNRTALGAPPAALTFSQPAHRTWDEVRAELELLDVWSLATGASLRVPDVVPEGGDRRGGLFVEVRTEGRVTREWYGDLRGARMQQAHQIRELGEFLADLWQRLRVERRAGSLRSPR